MPTEVPSFGSFAPPPPPPKDVDDDRKDKHRRSHAESSSASSSKRHRGEHRHHRHRDGEDSEDARPRKRSHRHDQEYETRHRDDDKRTSDHHHHSRNSHSSTKGKERAIDPPPPPTLDPSIGLFERHGDALSARHGSPEQSKVSQYKRSGSGIVLGLPSSLRILPEDKSALPSSSTGLRVGPKGSQKKSRSLLEDGAELKRNSAAPRRLLPRQKDAGQIDDDFVSLRSSGRPSKHNAAQAVAVYDPLQTKVADDDPSDEEDDHSDSEDGNDIYADSDLRSRLLDLDAATRERPEDSRVWIQLAQLQKELVDKGMSTWPHANAGRVVEQPESSSSSRRSARRQRALAEVQVSILDRARATHWHHRTFDIILARLHLVTTHGLESHQAIEKEWRKLLNYPIASEALGLCWSRYLEWRCSESDFATHKVVDGVDNDGEGSFVEAFQALHARHDPPRAMMFHLQRRLCQVLARAGYRARAFAILQAQLEYTFACPPEIDEQQDKARRETYILPLGFHERQAQEKLDALEEFWESEAPRFGEADAKGWKAWAASRNTAGEKAEEDGLMPNAHQHATNHSAWEDPQSLLPQADLRAPNGTALARWLAWQRRLAERRARPSRTTDLADLAAGEGEVDPYSVVFFSDVRPFVITAFTADEDREEALRSALDFLGLTSHEAAMTTAWPEDLSASEPQTQPRFDVVDGEPMQRQRASLLSDVDRFPFRDTTFLLAGGESLWPRLKGLSALPPASSLPQGALEASLVLLEGLQPYRDTRELRLKLVELLKGPQAAAHWAKELLAAAANEREAEEAMWPLWRAFAWLQRKLGNWKSARKVYKSCLESEGMVSKWGTVIWTEWLELEIEAGEGDASAAVAVAVDAITASSGTHSQPQAAAAPSPADILRAKSKALTLARPIEGDAATSEASALIAAWLAYLTSPNPSQRLTTTIHTLNDLISSAPITHGGLHMFANHRRRLFLHALLTRITSYHLSLPRRRPIYRPAEVRESLLSALQSSVKVGHIDDVLLFLTHLAAHESRFKMDGVLRRSIQTHLLSPLIDAKSAHLDPRDRYQTFEGGEDTEALGEAERAWLGAVYFEMHLHRDHVNANAVRGLLERGVEEFDATRRCGAIWRFYVGFEVRVAMRDHRGSGSSSSGGRKLRKALQRRAKPVLYRAIARCPYDSALYLSAFEEPLVGAFSQDELEQMVGVMADERDLRVYGKVQEVRELLRARREGGKEDEQREEGSSGSDGEAEDEDEG